MKVKKFHFKKTSLGIWKSKYQLRDLEGNVVDEDIDATYRRVARALADQEETAEKRAEWYPKFLWALQHGAIPAGRITSNAGALAYKPATSTINCTVSGRIGDSMDDIFKKIHEAALTLKAGCGIGYEMSTMRPKGGFVHGAGSTTNGPLAFMNVFDEMCDTVSSAGGRRGAQMATFDIQHPDVMDFIKAKRQDGVFRKFNLSLLITKDFLEAVKSDGDWPLVFPTTEKEVAALNLDLNDPGQVYYREWSSTEGYITNDEGLVACRIYKVIKALELWDVVMLSNYDFAEPGFILIDQYNEMNNNWFCENIRATNPCGEQGLPEYGACLLGSVNLTKFVVDPFTDDARFDWDEFAITIGIFARMLDNVVGINGLPLEQQREELISKRRHGMGYLGLGSAITMLKMVYGDEGSIEFTEKVTRTLAVTGWKVGLELAKEKGAAPIFDEAFTVTPEMLRKRPEMKTDGYKVGDKVAGRILHVRYSRYMQQLATVEPELMDEMAEYGCRYTHHSSIAPTGTIALSLANNASNGIEPSFAHHYSRNVIVEGKKTKQKLDVFSYELLAYRTLVNSEAIPFSEDPEKALPDYFATAETISPMDHIKIQAASQRWIDSSISKTANIPTEFPYEDFKDIYLVAYEADLKGCTTFRYNPEQFQGVLVKNEDLANTTYRFTLADGTEVEAKGDEEIEYDGELHTAANLYDGLKEGNYGKL